MALKDSFELFDGTGGTAFGTTWIAQTFTTTSAYLATDVALRCWRNGAPGNITVSIRATDGAGKPTGGDLCTATRAESEITVLPTLSWIKFTFSSPYSLDDATKYAIVYRATGGDAGNYFQAFGYDSSGYADGGYISSANSGSSWGSVSANRDMMFRVYGSLAPPGKAQNPTPTDDQENIKITGKDQLKILQWEAPV